MDDKTRSPAKNPPINGVCQLCQSTETTVKDFPKNKTRVFTCANCAGVWVFDVIADGEFITRRKFMRGWVA